VTTQLAPTTDIMIRYTARTVAAFETDCIRFFPAGTAGVRWRPKIGDPKLWQRRWRFPNGLGVVATYKAEEPLPGRAPLPGAVPLHRHQLITSVFRWTPQDKPSNLEVIYGAEIRRGATPEVTGDPPREVSIDFYSDRYLDLTDETGLADLLAETRGVAQ